MTSWVDEATLINRRFYEQGAAAYATRWADRSFALHLYERFVSLIGHGCLVLDLGCGPAHDSAELAARGLRPVACDIARAMLYEARSQDAVRGLLVQCDLRALPFETAFFDGVWASASLFHIKKQDVSIALSEVCRVLKSGGIFYNSMQEGEHDGLVPTRPDEPIPGFRHYSYYLTEEWRRLVEGAGFELLEQRLVRSELNVNPGARGWIETYARKR